MKLLTSQQSDEDTKLLAFLSQAQRDRVLAQITMLKQFGAEKNQSRVREQYANALGLSPSSLTRLYYRWSKHGVRGLVPARTYKQYAARTELGPEFAEYFKGVFERINSDSVPEARRQIVANIQRGERIPGVGTWRDLWDARFPDVPPPDAPNGWYPRNNIELLMPAGLSQRNLRRMRSEQIERIAAKQGTAAASKLGPHVYTTRVGLAVGQILMFDDVWHNVNVNYPGRSRRALRPIELCCLDVYSAHKCAYGMRPRLWNPETKKHEGVKDHEFRFLLAYTLTEAVGYRPEGTILWCERGTASIDAELEELLNIQSGGAITVKRAPLQPHRQLCSMYRGVYAGKSEFKSQIESHHNIGHTVLSSLPGQIGRAADVRPEEIYGRDKANEKLLKIAALLPPEHAEQLRLPYLDWDVYGDYVAEAYHRLATRDWHNLEGWDQERLHRREYCLPPSNWLPVSTLDDMAPDAANAMLAVLAEHPEFVRIQRLSPLDVFNRGRNNLVRLPKHVTPMILGPRNGTVRECPETSELQFKSLDLGAGSHIYSREYVDLAGCRCRLREGRHYLFHINPFSAARELYISTPEGQPLGCTPKINVPCRADFEAVQRRFAETKREFAKITGPVAARATRMLRQQDADMSANTALVKAGLQAGLLPAGSPAAPLPQPALTEAEEDDFDAALMEMQGVG